MTLTRPFWSIILLVLIHKQVQSSEYFGRLIGDLVTTAHGVSGKIYAANEDTLYITNFHYDGNAPAAYFLVGKEEPENPDPKVDYGKGENVSYPLNTPSGPSPPLPGFNGQNIALKLPYKIKEIKWISIWCHKFKALFGYIRIPKDFDPPKPKAIGEFTRLAHGVKSGIVTIIDSKTILISNLFYDGGGPDAFWLIGSGQVNAKNGIKIPDENENIEKLKGYTGQNITLRLPNHLTVQDIEWLTMYCIMYTQEFGTVKIPSKNSLNVPFDYPLEIVEANMNCLTMIENQVQMQWMKDEENIKFRLSGRMKDNQWLGLGFSNSGSTQMKDSDAVVIFWNSNEDITTQFHAEDYFLSELSQCTTTEGACPDAVYKDQKSQNDVIVFQDESKRENGITTVSFTRPINASDDRDIALNKEINIFIALGDLNSAQNLNYSQVLKHSLTSSELSSTPNLKNIKVDFSNEKYKINTCPILLENLQDVNQPEGGNKPWPAIILRGVKHFKAEIGATGGDKGYKGITGISPWGIAWWINDKLIPEIFVERGETYTFEIHGGADSSLAAKYHPFYITNDPIGGYSQKDQTERAKVKVYAGIDLSNPSNPKPTAAGQYCEWEHKGIDQWESSKTFEDYKKTLLRQCTTNPNDQMQYKLSWTVPSDAPNTLYYQCYTHNNLGWKIHVTNKEAKNNGIKKKSEITTTFILLVTSSFVWRFLINL